MKKKDDHKQTNFNNDYKNILFNNDLYVEGYFESEKYFVKYRDQIINEFKFKNSDLYKNNPYFKNLIQSNSVAICVRQNRFIEGKNRDNKANRVTPNKLSYIFFNCFLSLGVINLLIK